MERDLAHAPRARNGRTRRHAWHSLAIRAQPRIEPGPRPGVDSLHEASSPAPRGSPPRPALRPRRGPRRRPGKRRLVRGVLAGPRPAQAAATAAGKGDAQAAAACVDRAAEQTAGKVVYAGDGLYLPAWRIVHRRTRALPQVVQDAYAALARDKALASLAEARTARDLAAQAALVRARIAVLPSQEVFRVSQELTEAGLGHAAEAFLEELVLHSPPSPSHAAATLALAQAYASRHEPDAVAALCKAQSPDALDLPISVGGASLPLSEWLARYGSVERPTPLPRAALPGGGLVPLPRCGVPAEKAAWSTSVPVLSDLLRAPKKEEEMEEAMIMLGRSGNPATYQLSSAIAGANVVVHLGKSLFAFRLTDGKQAWTRGGERGLAAFLAGPAAQAFGGLVVEGDRVIAVMAGRGDEGKRRGDLVCLDAASGKVVWWLNDENDGKGMTFTGVPLVHEGRIYAAAVEDEDSGRLHVVCVLAESGKPVWKRFLASRPPPNEDYGVAYRPEAVFTVRGKTLFACTAMGVVAALAPIDGDFIWGLKYGEAAANEEESRYGARSPSCAVSPVLDLPEGLWMAPADLSRYFLLDPVGRSIRTSRRKDVGEAYRFLVGGDGGRLILGGREVGVYSRAKGLLAHRALSASEGGARPALAEGLLLVPRARELVALETGGLDERWSIPIEKGQSGDVLVTEDGVVLVSHAKVTFIPWKK